MTIFEIYTNLVNVIKPSITVPFFAKGQTINQKPPFVVVDIYPTGVSRRTTKTAQNMGCKITCYGTNPVLALKLTSEVQDILDNKSNTIYESVEAVDGIVKLDEKLYFGKVKLTVRNVIGV